MSIKAGGAVVVLDDAGHVRGTHAVLPEATRAKVCIFRRLYLEAALRGGLGVHSLCSGPLLGHTPTACIALSFGLIFVLRGPMCSLRALASNATVASGLWTTAAYRIKSIFSSTCRQGGWDEGKHHGITRDCGKHRGWKW
jgi:hypothetical protein